jgi:hypothetical protein
MAEDSVHIPTGVKHSDNGDGPRDRIINDKIGKHRPELDGQRSQILSEMADLGV